jgi:hypothetical protein
MRDKRGNNVRKIVGMIIAALFIVSAYGGATRTNQNDSFLIDKISICNEPPYPGCIVNSNFIKETPYLIKITDIFEKNIGFTYDPIIIKIIQRIETSMIQGYLENLTAFGPRVTSESACYNAGMYIYNEFIDMGLEVKQFNWSAKEYGIDFNGTDIEATLNGVDKTSDEIYIICAHYDSVPGSPGADDDGSGVAAVLSAAEIMSHYNFSHTVKFITFDGEEQGLLGSFFYAKNADESLDNIIVVLNMDLIGYKKFPSSPKILRIFYDDNSYSLAEFTANVSLKYDDVIDCDVRFSGWTDTSDHYAFWLWGYRALFYFEGERTPYYHTYQDTVANMDMEYNTQTARLIIATLCELSQPNSQPDKPNTPSGPTSGNPEIEYPYTTSTIDIDEDQIWYYWDFGGNSTSGWIGPYNTGETCEIKHQWSSQGGYFIKVKAKDSYDLESLWSDPLEVTMPKNRVANKLLQSFLDQLMFRFSFFEKILNQYY